MENQRQIEFAGDLFVKEAVLAAQQRAWDTVEDIAKSLPAGITEKDAIEFSREAFARGGADKHWHKPVVRFGNKTSKAYPDPFDPEDILQAEDMILLDFAPVYDGIEADIGKTFLRGHDAEKQKCIDDSRSLWKSMRDAWFNEKLSGRELYDFGIQASKNLGWVYKMDGAEGHRLSEFPHKLHYEGNLCDRRFHPSPLVWILEVHLVDPAQRFGAFFEDILI